MAARRMIRAISGLHCSDDSRLGLQAIQGLTRCSLGDLMVVVRSVVIVASVVRVTSVDGKGTARERQEDACGQYAKTLLA